VARQDFLPAPALGEIVHWWHTVGLAVGQVEFMRDLVNHHVEAVPGCGEVLLDIGPGQHNRSVRPGFAGEVIVPLGDYLCVSVAVVPAHAELTGIDQHLVPMAEPFERQVQQWQASLGREQKPLALVEFESLHAGDRAFGEKACGQPCDALQLFGTASPQQQQLAPQQLAREVIEFGRALTERAPEPTEHCQSARAVSGSSPAAHCASHRRAAAAAWQQRLWGSMRPMRSHLAAPNSSLRVRR
jgi:hypothetical protein